MRFDEKSKQSKWHGQRVVPIVMAVLTLVSVIAAVYVAVYEVPAMKGQLKVMKDTLKHAERSSIIQLRAYVLAEPGRIVNFANDGSPPEAYVWVVNGGVTPAANIRQDIRAVVLAPPITEEQITFREIDRESGPATMPPKGRKQAHRMFRDGDNLFVESEESFRAVRGEEEYPLYLYVFGTIEYRDVFNEPRSTEFCFYYSGNHEDRSSVIPGQGYHGRQAQSCEIHNKIK